MNIWNDNHLGNYWDSYCGLDFDGDGIGDKPKNIKGDNNPDNCPLMAPYCLKTSVRIKVPQQGNIYLRNLPIASYPSTIVFGNLDINIKKVEFYIDGLLRHIDRWPPFSWRWIVSSHIKHNHTITVIAYDSVGNKSTDELQLIRFL
jgi:hypothetical protein